MEKLLLAFKIIYWLAIAYLPFALDDKIVDFILWGISNPGSECLKFGVPLTTHVYLISWVAGILLWPLAAWNLCGRYIWQRYRTKNNSKPGVVG